jgi:threonine aldolase
MHIELRSDTFTKPTAEMLASMQQAQVGDDVFGEDITVNELQEYCAQLFNKPAALYCPTGTMTNQIAIKCHTQPGDEVICEVNSHVYQYEGGGIAFNSGASVNLLNGKNGCISAEQVLTAINNRNDVHKAYSSLVSLENTNNRAGGTCYAIDDIIAIKQVCQTNNLKLHLDGARLFNAIIATNTNPVDYGNLFDSISICLSKGLGAPIGSVLIGDAAFIAKAKRYRKIFGGGMRQAGYMAAAGLYALKNHIPFLEKDHLHAKAIAASLINKNFVLHVFPVTTNIIIFEVGGKYTAAELIEILKTNNIQAIAISSTHIRFVLHYDVTAAMVYNIITVIDKL